MYPQFYDTTLVLNSKLNVISQIDSRQENPANSIVGFPINEYFLQSNFIYRITVKGEVLLNSAGDRCPGPCILIAGSIFYGLEAAEPMTFILSPDDTIEYIPERVENLYLGAYIFDPDTIGDNSGEFLLKIEIMGWVDIGENEFRPDLSFEVAQNYPNPFNSSTVIKYKLQKTSWVEINVYNLLGQKIIMLKSAIENHGWHFVKWNGNNEFGYQVGSGIYIYQVKVNDRIKTQRMVYLK